MSWLELTLAARSAGSNCQKSVGTLSEKICFLPGPSKQLTWRPHISRRWLPVRTTAIDAVTNHPQMLGKFQLVARRGIGVGKPAPDIYLKPPGTGRAARSCVCLEDSSNGIISGKGRNESNRRADPVSA
jgi:hypothetical protein